MKLYHHPLSPNCRKPRAVIEHLGLEVEQEIVDITKGAQQDPAFLAINPNGKVPALAHDGGVLWESNAISCFLAGSVDDTSLWPKSMARYDIMRWQAWELAHWNKPAGQLIGEHIFKPMRGGEPDAEVIKAAEEEFARWATVLNGHLEGKDWLVGDGLTLADFSVGAILTYAGPAKFPLDGYNYLNAWRERLDAVEAWQKSAPPPM